MACAPEYRHGWPMSLDFFIAAFGAILCLAAAIYSLRFIFDYRIRDPYIELSLFRRISIFKLQVKNVETIRKIS
jgi:hypothetical protein